MNISEIVDDKNHCISNEVESLKVEVKLFLKKMKAGQAEILAERSDQILSPDNLEKFFRKKERNEKIDQVLQYLLTFLDHIPGTSEIENVPFNPIEQFRECVRFEVNLLLEEDVKKAVFNEINCVNSFNGDNVWDYQQRIIEKNRELIELIATGGSDIARTVFTLCLVLEHLCVFWFDIKQGDIRRTRRSDIYLYKLAKILQDRYKHDSNENKKPVMDGDG